MRVTARIPAGLYAPPPYDPPSIGEFAMRPVAFLAMLAAFTLGAYVSRPRSGLDDGGRVSRLHLCASV